MFTGNYLLTVFAPRTPVFIGTVLILKILFSGYHKVAVSSEPRGVVHKGLVYHAVHCLNTQKITLIRYTHWCMSDIRANMKVLISKIS